MKRVLLFALIFTGLTSLLIYFIVSDVLLQINTSSYIAITGQVIESKIDYETVRNERARKEYIRTLSITYSYNVNGKSYTGTRYFANQNAINDEKWVTKYVREHPKGSSLTVYYDPKKPSDAVLVKGLSGHELYVCLFIYPFFITSLVLWGLFFHMLFFYKNYVGIRYFVEKPDGVHLRFTLIPSLTGLLLSVITAIACIVISNLTSISTQPSLFVGILYWVAVALSITWGINSTRRRNKLGKDDVVINRSKKQITLPKTWKDKSQALSFSQIQEIKVEEIRRQKTLNLGYFKDFISNPTQNTYNRLEEHLEDREENPMYYYAPTIHWIDFENGKSKRSLIDLADENEAKEIVSWLKRQISTI